MFKIGSTAIIFALLQTTCKAFRDCTMPGDGVYPELDHLLCGDYMHRCDANQIPVTFDFSEIYHKHFIRHLRIPLPGFEGKKVGVGAKGVFVHGKYRGYTPDNEGRRPKRGAGWMVLEDGSGAARVMDTASPGADPDLGTPNEAFGGPGVGANGSSNKIYLGKAVFVQEQNKANVDDNRFGGEVLFDFWQVKEKVTVTEIGLIDVEEGSTISTDKGMLEVPAGANDNGVTKFSVDATGEDLSYLAVNFRASGAIAYMKACIDLPPPPCGSDCDDGNLCTIDTCENGVCVNTPLECGENESCDAIDGQCKPDDGLRPCIAVIDESSTLSLNQVNTKWAAFRATFPDRPFCLLQPQIPNTGNDQLFLPTNPDFLSDPRTVFAQVNRDNGNVNLASDWLTICGYGDLATTGTEFVALFIDTSGSMTLNTVASSFAKFETDVVAAGLTYCSVQNSLEDWIDPFDTVLGDIGGGGNCQVP